MLIHAVINDFHYQLQLIICLRLLGYKCLRKKLEDLADCTCLQRLRLLLFFETSCYHPDLHEKGRRDLPPYSPTALHQTIHQTIRVLCSNLHPSSSSTNDWRYILNAETVSCSSSASLDSDVAEAAISSMEASCSSVAAETFCVPSAVTSDPSAIKLITSTT